MQTDTPYLFVEINFSNYIFVAGTYDKNQNLKIIEKIAIRNEGSINNKFTNFEQAHNVIKKNIQTIEDKLNYVFKDVIVILDNFSLSCINISASKKLNGSQLMKENISYILNSLKLAVTENEKEKTILHIFNSGSILDETRVENLPIGLFGDFYSHELTFFLIKDNDLKNIKLIFNKNNLNVKKVLIKNFIEGAQLIDDKDKIKTFFKIKINKDNSNLSFFDKASFKYSENFNFGSDIIFKDIMKVCSIDNEIIKKILLEQFKDKVFEESELLEKKYFGQGNFRKIKKQLILDIVNARIEEITNIILNKNINLDSFKQGNVKIYLIIEDQIIFDNFKENFSTYFSKHYNFDIHLVDGFRIEESIISASSITNYGWEKEAIPITQIKNSLIARIFKSLFG